MSRPPFSSKRKGQRVDPYPLGAKEKGKTRRTKRSRKGRPRKEKLSQDDILQKILGLAPLKKKYYFDFKTLDSKEEVYKRHGGHAHMRWVGRDVTITTHKGVPERDITHEIGHLHWKDSQKLRDEYTSRLRGKAEFEPIERFAVDFEQVYVDIQKGRPSKTAVQRYIRETLFKESVEILEEDRSR